MLRDSDKAIISYCSQFGTTADELAGIFKKSPQWIGQIRKHHVSTYFPNEEAQRWFEAGIKACKISQKRENPPTEICTAPRLCDYRRIKAQAREALIAMRSQHLPGRQQDLNCSERCLEEEEEIEEINDDDDSVSESENRKLGRLIACSMMTNLEKKSANARRYPLEVVKFAYVLKSYSNACYDYLRSVLPLPSRQIIDSRYKVVERRIMTHYQNPDCMGEIIEAYLDRHPMDSLQEKLQCTISIDAFSMTVWKKKSSYGSEQKGPLGCETEVSLNRVAHEEVHEKGKPSNPGPSTDYCNSIFLVVLHPLRWDKPSVPLMALPWRSGHADKDVVTVLLNVIKGLEIYNIEVRAIASDGDSGYSCLHKGMFKLWKQKRNADFFDIFNRISMEAKFRVKLEDSLFVLQCFPVADPLHALKIARSRVLTHTVFLASDVQVSRESFEIFKDETWFSDQTQLGKMSDYHAIAMFSPESILELTKAGQIAAAVYLWPWTALILVIRVPFLTLDCRRSLLHGALKMCQFFFNQTSADFPGHDVNVRFTDGCDGVTFFETSYLLRVLHLILGIFGELVNGAHKLRLSCFGSHITENIIGRIRVACHGNPTLDVVMRAMAKAEMMRILQSELGVVPIIRARDNAGGTKLDAGIACNEEGLDFARISDMLIDALKSADIDLAKEALGCLSGFLQAVHDRRKEVFHLYLPNAAANSGIMARLLRFRDSSGQQKKCQQTDHSART